MQFFFFALGITCTPYHTGYVCSLYIDGKYFVIYALYMYALLCGKNTFSAQDKHLTSYVDT